MRRTLLIGWILGALTFLSGLTIGSNWYEYRIVATFEQQRAMVNDQGWEIVPGQSSLVYLRRPRLHVP